MPDGYLLVISGLLAGAFLGAGLFYLLGRSHGHAAGSRAEREKLEVRVTPHLSKECQWLGMKKILQVGYAQQIFYGGLPIGLPQTVITNVESTWNEEMVREVVAGAKEVAKVYTNELVKNGIRAALSA